MTALRHVLHEHCPAQLAVETITNAPPQHSIGRRVIVGPAPSGVFSGYANRIAWSNGLSWQFDHPMHGWRVYVEALQDEFVYHNHQWQRAIIISARGDLIIGGTNGVPERLAGVSAAGVRRFLRQYRDEPGQAIHTVWDDVKYSDIGDVPSGRLLGRYSQGTGGSELIALGENLELTPEGRLNCTVQGSGGPAACYFHAHNNQPSHAGPGLQLTHAVPRFIALDRHGILNEKGAYSVVVDLLLHGDHRFTSTGLRYGFSIIRRYEFVVYVEDVPGTGDLPYFSSIKTTVAAGKCIRYSGSTNLVVAQGELQEQDVGASLSVVSTYLRLNIVNNLLNNPHLSGFDFPLYGQYTVRVAGFASTMTASTGSGEQQPAG